MTSLATTVEVLIQRSRRGLAIVVITLLVAPFVAHSFGPTQIASAAEPVELAMPDTKVAALAFSADGKLLAVGTNSRAPTAKVFEVATKKEVLDVPCTGRGAAFTVALSSDGKLLAIGDYDSAVTIRKVADGAEVVSLPNDPDRKKYRQARRVAFLPDSQRLVVGYSTGEVHVWDLASRMVVTKFDHRHEITALAVSRDGGLIATGSDFGLRVWNATDGKATLSADQTSSGQHGVQAIAFLPDGKTVATADSPGWVKFFALDGGQVTSSFKMPAVGRETTIYGLAITADGKSAIAPGHMNGLDPERPRVLREGLVVLDVAAAKPRAFLPTVSCRVLAVAADDRTAAIATGDTGDPVFVYDLQAAAALKP